MIVTPYFDNITQKIITLLQGSQSNIKICMAWFTDQEIMNVLIERVQKGLSIDLILFDTVNNKNKTATKVGLQILENFKISLSTFKEAGGNVILIKEISDFYLHSKFCVIDNEIVITGSYNWTYPARTHIENIVVIEDKNTAAEFNKEFKKIKSRKFGLVLDRSFPYCSIPSCTGKLIRMRLFNYNYLNDQEYSEDYADFQVCDHDITHIQNILFNDTWKPYFYEVYENEYNRLQNIHDSENINDETLKKNIDNELANYVGSRSDLFSNSIADDILILGKVTTVLTGYDEEEDVIKIIWNHEIANYLVEDIKDSIEYITEALNE